MKRLERRIEKSSDESDNAECRIFNQIFIIGYLDYGRLSVKREERLYLCNRLYVAFLEKYRKI